MVELQGAVIHSLLIMTGFPLSGFTTDDFVTLLFSVKKLFGQICSEEVPSIMFKASCIINEAELDSVLVSSYFCYPKMHCSF